MDNTLPTSLTTTYMHDESDDITFGTKQIVILCISAVIVIVLIMVGRFLCIKHRQEQALKDAKEIEKEQSNEKTTVEMAGSTTFTTVQSESVLDITQTTNIPPSSSSINEYQIGAHVHLKDGKQGIVRYVGPTTFSNDISYGIELDSEYEGEHSGKVKGITYFECSVANKGIFVAVTDILPPTQTTETQKTEDKQYKIGDYIQLKDDRQGCIRYIGPTAFSKDDLYGIELNEQYEGEHSGNVKGVKYFDCTVENKGIFVTKSDIL